MANGLLRRFGPPDRIRYLLLAGTREPYTVHIPDSLSRGYLEQLRLMPKATHQFLDPIGWHKKAQTVRCFRHYDFGVVYDDTPEEILGTEIRSQQLVVIFLHSRLTAVWDIIRNNRHKCLVLSTDAQLGTDFSADEELRQCYCTDLDDFFSKLTQQIAELLHHERGDVDRLIDNRVAELKKSLETINDNADADFRACVPNTHTFLQLLAPYGRDVLKLEQVEHLKRPEALVKSAERVLNAYAVVTARSSGTEQDWPDHMPPLILTWPYYGPNHKALFKSLVQEQSGERREALKVMGEVALGEQDPKSYEYHIDSRLMSNHEAVMTAIGEFQVKMVAYMDNLGYLHASFQDSPVLRMPLTGKSVNESLGSFQKSCIGPNSSSKRATTRLKKCGEVLGSRFAPGFLAHIDRYYDQMVAITDIPIEWTICDGVPLGFLVDICRLPQSNPTSIMAQFASNSAQGYSVKSNILEKTLIICGVDSTETIGECFDSFAAKLSASDAGGPTAVRCLTKADFVAAIEKHKPDLLIVDSHGNFESNEEGSYLCVGDEKIVGDDILALKHGVPLVMLSCCLTAPLYGCSNTIAQAFFESGSCSVVSTFLPISVDRGYLLYQRVLKNLASSVTESYHRNWLSFISHNLRTSHFDDYLFPLRDTLKQWEDFDLFLNSRTPWMMDCMNPATRRRAYTATKEAVLNSFRPAVRDKARKALQSQHFIPEAFYYTHLGRADLVQFDIWLEKEVASDPEAKEIYEDLAPSWCL